MKYELSRNVPVVDNLTSKRDYTLRKWRAVTVFVSTREIKTRTKREKLLAAKRKPVTVREGSWNYKNSTRI